MSEENKLVPELRFPDFRGEMDWVAKTIGEFAPLQRGFDLPIEDIVCGEYPVVFSNGILKYHNQYKVQAPGIVTGRSGTIGKVTYVKENFWPHNTSLWVTNFYNNFPLYVYYYFIYIKLERFGTGSGVPTLNRNDVHRYKISVTNSTKEQQKIAFCLASLDEVITSHSQKLELLKEHKKSLMQNLFPQEGETVPKYRFPEFTDDEKWKEKKLGDICTMQAGKFVNASDINSILASNLHPCYGGNGLRGYTKSYTHIGTYSLIGRQGALCGNVTLANGKFHATEHAVVVNPKKDTDTIWLFYMLELLNLNQYATGQAQPGLSVNNLEQVKLNIPENTKEQLKIASLLSSIDKVITAQTEKIEQLKLHKKGLIQGLFPKINN